MKCILSSSNQKVIAVVRSNGDYLCAIACLSSIFQQTVVPNVVYFITEDCDQRTYDVIRYFNGNTVMKMQLVCSEFDIDKEATKDAFVIHLLSNSVIDREYIKTELCGEKTLISVALSSRISNRIIDEVHYCQTEYVDIYRMIPLYVRLYVWFLSKTYKLIHSKNRCQVLFMIDSSHHK